MRRSNEEPLLKSQKLSTPVRQTTTEKCPATPSTKVAEGSRADYTCYTIRNPENVLAVVIETKMDQSSQDALAQVYPHPLPEHITPVPTYTAGSGVRRCI